MTWTGMAARSVGPGDPSPRAMAIGNETVGATIFDSFNKKISFALLSMFSLIRKMNNFGD